jgi:hypothetical protein
MISWMADLLDPIYGVVDLFLDRPLAMTVAAAVVVLLATALLALR